MNKTLKRTGTFVLTCFFLFLGSQAFANNQELLGAGATFPQPLYSKMFDAYYQQYKVKINSGYRFWWWHQPAYKKDR